MESDKDSGLEKAVRSMSSESGRRFERPSLTWSWSRVRKARNWVVVAGSDPVAVVGVVVVVVGMVAGVVWEVVRGRMGGAVVAIGLDLEEREFRRKGRSDVGKLGESLGIKREKIGID